MINSVLKHYQPSTYLLLFILTILTFVACTAAPATSEPRLDPDPEAAALLPTALAPAATVDIQPTATPEDTPAPPPSPSPVATDLPTPTPTETPTPSPTLPPSPTPIEWQGALNYGRSLQDRDLTAVRFGTGERVIVLIGGIHGGYEWNTIVFAYDLIEYFENNPAAIPPDVTLYIIPSANPDGQFTVTAQTGRFSADIISADMDTTWGRFNARGVDLNRNWDCGWQEVGYWGIREVSAGSVPFSEPESANLRDFLVGLNPAPLGVVFWHSAANAVFDAQCGEPYPASTDLAKLYSAGSGYPIPSGGFSAYPITGDAANWLATQDIPAITVEFRNHTDLDWNQNLNGTLALLESLGK